MAESELKLDAPCPWCGTPNGVSASRCRQCYQELGAVVEEAPPGPTLFDASRVTAACPSCGKTNFLSGERCFECGAGMRAANEAPVRPARFRRRSSRLESGWIKMAWLLRLASVLYLFWGAIDTSLWLNNATTGMATQHAAATRFTVHALFELARNLCLVVGIWLLTFLHIGRDEDAGRSP